METRFSIGGVVIGLSGDPSAGAPHLEDGYREFLTDAEPDVVLHICPGDLPRLSGWQLAFDSGGVFRLYRGERLCAVTLSSPAMQGVYQVAILSPDFSEGEIYSVPCHWAPQQSCFPLGYPLAEIIMAGVLGQGMGVLMHACAFSDGEAGFLFAGTSGSGKSTMAGIWGRQPGIVLLSDDRVILRRHDGEFWIYGTPWHGNARAAAAVRAPLSKVFILHHGRENVTVPLAPPQAASALFVRSFPPFWDASGVAASLQLLGEVVESAPCLQLDFLPDDGIVAFVKHLNENWVREGATNCSALPGRDNESVAREQ
jgi:hypothetical protein